MTSGSDAGGAPEDGDAYGRNRRRQEADSRRTREEDELARAIEESKKLARENEERIRREAKE